MQILDNPVPITVTTMAGEAFTAHNHCIITFGGPENVTYMYNVCIIFRGAIQTESRRYRLKKTLKYMILCILVIFCTVIGNVH